MDDKDLREDFQKTVNRIGKEVTDDMLGDKVLDDKDIEKAIREEFQEAINRIYKSITDDMFETSEMVKDFEWRLIRKPKEEANDEDNCRQLH